MRDLSLVASKADIRRQAIKGGEVPGGGVCIAVVWSAVHWLI